MSIHSDERALFGCHGGGATQNIYIHNLVIQGGPGAYDVKVTLSLGQRIAALFGRGPSAKQMEQWARTQLLGEPTTPKGNEK